MDEESISALRRQLAQLGQEHVLEGFSSGDICEKQALIDQLSTVDFSLFQRGLTDVLHSLDRQNGYVLFHYNGFDSVRLAPACVLSLHYEDVFFADLCLWFL